MSRRTVALVLAVLLAALATIALISYVSGLEDKVYEGQQVVDVFVAKQDIAPGVSGDTASSQGLLVSTKIAEKVVPEGAITSLQEISGKIAAVQIFKDEIIVGARFVAPGAAVRGVLPIAQGKQAISVQVGTPAGVAGFVQPGDQVSIIVHLAREGRPPAGGEIARYLLQRIDVLAVGTRVVAVGAAQQGQEQQAQNVACCLFTLAVSPGQAEQLVYAQTNGQLTFTLLPEGAQPVNSGGRTIVNLFN